MRSWQTHTSRELCNVFGIRVKTFHGIILYVSGYEQNIFSLDYWIRDRALVRSKIHFGPTLDDAEQTCRGVGVETWEDCAWYEFVWPGTHSGDCISKSRSVVRM